MTSAREAKPVEKNAADPSADTTALEREIDERVHRLYGLTEGEIKLVEGDRQ